MRKENRMINNLERKIAILKKAQDAHEVDICPRCGMGVIESELINNPLSRYADLYICESCGSDEAFRDMDHNPIMMDDWDVFKM
jgi:superfamily II helicase